MQSNRVAATDFENPVGIEIPPPNAKPANERTKKNVITILGVVAFIFLVTTILFAVLYAVEANRDEDSSRGECPVQGAYVPETGDLAEFSNNVDRVKEMFDTITPEELLAVRNFAVQEWGLTPIADRSSEQFDEDYLLTTELAPAPKAAAKDYIDGVSDTSPGRYAHAFVVKGSEATPMVHVYLVGPLGGTLTATELTAPNHPYPVPFNMSALNGMVETFIADLDAENFWTTAYGLTADDIWWTDSSPRGYDRASRKTWHWFNAWGEGQYIYPLGLTVLIDHQDLDPQNWSIERIVFNGQGPYATVADLITASADSGFEWPSRPIDSSFGSLKRRDGAPRRPRERLAMPDIVYPQGRRFGVDGSMVSWMGWQFHVNWNIFGGLQLNDLRFRTDRIVWEVSLQDAYAKYSGYQPLQSLSQYNDVGWGQGYASFELIKGVDCPRDALYLPRNFLVDSDTVTQLKDAVCIFERPTSIAAQRHYDQDYEGSYVFAAGYPGSELVVRTTHTVYNYDYIISVVFYLDGSFETFSHATGYLQAEWYLDNGNENPFSTRIHDNTIGSIHDHLFSWKLDMDILGTNNRLTRSELKVGTTALPWGGDLPGSSVQQVYKEMVQVTTETEGSSTYDVSLDAPVTFLFHANQANDWGVMRSYGLVVHTAAKQHITNAPWLPANEWTKHHITVTQRKDSEPRSGAPFFDMQAPAEPLFRFGDFTNGDSLVDQDLVAWICTGLVHVPHSEDVPVTYTIGNSVGFRFRPYNYFRESPLTDLTRYFYVSKENGVEVDTTNIAAGEECFEPTPERDWVGEPIEL
ncbi:unnamed protein product [Symbiodinium sp. KB8]|nr:unnamed protein product [Symbiodinium sp. KB8]